MSNLETNPIYPIGIEYRTPRPRQELAGALLGGLGGLAFSKNLGGTAIGSTVGGALGSELPLELSSALRQFFTDQGFELTHFYRLGRFGAKTIFKYFDTYVALESHAPRQPEMSLEQIEDWIYGDLTENRFNNFIQNFSRRFAK